MFATCQALIWALETQRHSCSALKHHYHYPVGFLEKDILFLPQGLCIYSSFFLGLPSLQLSSLALASPYFPFLHKCHLLKETFSDPLPQTRLDPPVTHTWYFSFVNLIATALK